MDIAAPRVRLRLIGIVAISLFVAMFARLWFVQVVDAETYQADAVANIRRKVATPAPRGRIIDAVGRVLVENRLTNVLVINRQDFRRARLSDKEAQAMFVRLAREINRAGGLVKADDLAAAADNNNFTDLERIPISWDVPDDLLVVVGERPDEFPGMAVVQQAVRTYPYGNIGAHVIGYVGAITGGELERSKASWEARDEENPKPYRRRDEIGKTGIELLFEDQLRGTPGQRVFEVDNVGNIVRELVEERREPVPGNDIVLTIDIDVQALAEDELAESLREARKQEPDPGEPQFAAPAGSTVIVDPRNGQVLAMASYPTFEPADLIDGVSADEWKQLNDKANNSPILNRAIQSTYSPGSTWKLVTSYAAFLDNIYGAGNVPSIGQTIPDESAYILQDCDEESGSCRFQNAGDTILVGINLVQSLAVSSDTYYYRIGEAFARRGSSPEEHAENPDGLVNKDGIQETAKLFGFGRKLGIELPNEKAGLVPTAELKQQRHDANPEAFPFARWFVGDNVNLAIGQGDVGVTPLQLANAYATWANGGTLRAPSVVGQIVGPDGEVIQDFGPRVLSSFEIDPEHYGPITDGLIGVTHQGPPQQGTAYPAFHSADGVPFPLADFPVAAKTGTAEVNDKADTSIFAAYGPVARPEIGLVDVEPRYAVAAILEQAGFGSRVAAPMVARIMLALANGEVPPAVTADERTAAYLAQLDPDPALLDLLPDDAVLATTIPPGAAADDPAEADADPVGEG